MALCLSAMSPIYCFRGVTLLKLNGMDLNLNYDFKNIRKNWEQSVNIGIYNLYGRKNPVYSYFEIDLENTAIANLTHVSFYSMVPSLMYSITF